MPENPIERRTLLRGVGAGLAGTTLAGQVAADGRGEYVVGVYPDRGVGEARAAADSVRRELDFGAVGRAVSGRFSDRAVEALEANPNVRYVEKNGTMEALAQTTPYGIEKVRADVAHDEGETGDGADVAIIDTGIDAQHEDLSGHLGEGWAATEAACQDDCSGGIFCDPNDIDTCYEAWDDDNDHGTHCAGIVGAVDDDRGVVGVAPDVTLHAVKVLDCCGSGSYDDIAAGIEWTADQGYDVGSLSLGGDDSSVVRDACQYAYGQGVLLVAAAGNDGECTDCVGYPAAYDECIAVSATDENDDLASFSSTGPEVELAAPGVDVLSSIPRDDYARFSGTSMACPHVSGGGAQLMANGYTNTEARQRLRDTADDIGLPENEQGHGRLNVAEALGLDGGGAVAVSTGSATDATDSSATLNGSLDDLGGADSADVHFEYGPSGGSLSNATSSQTLSSTGSFSDEVTGLESGTEYEFRAVAEASDGDADTGGTATFTTDGGDGGGAPAIDRFEVRNRSNGGWARFEVDWAVSDADGDLSTVDLVMERNGGEVDSANYAASGTDASGSTRLEEKKGSGEYDITLTVTDEAGNSTSRTKTVTA